MHDFYRRLSRSVITVSFLMGACCLAVGAALGVYWTKSEVVPWSLLNLALEVSNQW